MSFLLYVSFYWSSTEILLTCIQNSVEDASKHVASMVKEGLKDKFCHVAANVVSQFLSIVFHQPGNALKSQSEERKYLCERLAPLFTLIEHTFNNIRWSYIEIASKATKQVMHVSGKRTTTFNVDIMGCLTTGESAELVFIEQSGGPDLTNGSLHAIGDAEKVINEAINGLRAKLCNFLDVPVDVIRSVKSFLLQVIGTRLTLASVQCVGKNVFAVVELKTAMVPNSWDDVDMYEEVLDLLFCLENEVTKQQSCKKTLRARLRLSKKEKYDGITIRDWLQGIPGGNAIGIQK
ncbi:hypothetical protein HK096_005546 [Nowakowskiella sp. JEL0078]|nr:hypothetical protein HK096_005546 [Nowakowskiella sp. JEL0078]